VLVVGPHMCHGACRECARRSMRYADGVISPTLFRRYHVKSANSRRIRS
jgi:hypothetical protein